MPRRLVAPLRLAALLSLVALPLACRAPVAALGDSAAQARANADALLTALASRFGPQDRDPKLATIRPKLTQHALTPSPLFDDESLWSSRTDSTRFLAIVGSGSSGHYRLAAAPALPELTRPADYRRETRLTRLGKHDYEWFVRDELAIGPVTGNQLGAALDAIFLAAEHNDEPAARRAYREQLPRTTAALSSLFTLDTLRLTPNPAGGTDVRLTILVHPAGLAATAPRYAHYLDKYLTPSRAELIVEDDDGREWWRAGSKGDTITLTLRVHDGSLAPRTGPPARIPDRLHVRIAASTKSWLFRVGLSALVGDVILTREPHEKAFTALFRREPDWQLPPFVEQMLHAPLRRPFDDNGAMLAFSLRDGAGTAAPGPSRALREYRIAVSESRIMRWFGGLGNSAVSEFRQGAEEEADRYIGSVLAALGADVAALAAPAAARTPGSGSPGPK
jgi:hypothetical protein